jgi:hypothetical protein
MATDSRDEQYIKALQAEADERRKQDAINTNILNSDDPNLLIAQDIIIGMAVGSVVDAVTVDLLKDSLLRALKGQKAVKIPFKNSSKVLKLSPKAILECIKSSVDRIKTQGLKAIKVLNQAPKAMKAAVAAAKAVRNAVKNAVKKAATQSVSTSVRLSGRAAERMARFVASQTAKVATRVATKVATMTTNIGTKVAMMASTCVAGPIVCAASMAITVVLLAFDVVNIVLDILDAKGYSVVLYKADIKAVAESSKEWMNSEYNTEENRNFFDEEIFFDWESFLYDIDDDGNFFANEVWAPRYEQLRDEYMTSIGITGDWRSRVDTIDMSTPTDPGALSPVTVHMQELKKQFKPKKKKPKKKKNNTTIILVASILTIVFVVGIIIFMNSNGEGSEPSTNNKGA